jgi:hypothetical protein
MQAAQNTFGQPSLEHSTIMPPPSSWHCLLCAHHEQYRSLPFESLAHWSGLPSLRKYLTQLSQLATASVW